MRRSIIFILSLVSFILSYGQNISGNWAGEVPVFDNSNASTLELFIEQKSDSLSGVSRYTNMRTGEYVEKIFAGVIKNRQFILREHEIINSFLLPNRGMDTGWYLKEMRGTVQIDDNNEIIAINGTILGTKIMNNFSAQTTLGFYNLPRRFTLNRVALEEDITGEGF